MYYSSSSSFLDVLGGAIALIFIIILALVVLYIVAMWRIFQKAGQPGWAAIVPFYNSYIMFKIFWGNGWLFLAPIACVFLGMIPLLGFIFTILGIVIWVLNAYKQAVAFGQGVGFTIGLIFLGVIFDMILAFGDYVYYGVPQDGTSYDQLRVKAEAAKARTASMNYQQPPREPNGAPNNMRYTQPNGTSNNGYYPPNGAPNNGYYPPNGAQNNGYAQPNQAQNNAQNPGGYAQPNGAQPNTKRCPQCGNSCGINAQFCGKCGARFY